MGQKDISQVRYFDDQGRFADLINGYLFKGKQVVSQEDVLEMDSRVVGIWGKLKDRFMVQRYRDCVRKVVFGTAFAIVGVENQDRIHYGMPIRVMMEDAAGYDRQMHQIRKRHRGRRDLRGDEFVSGFAKKDRVYPVVTICIYYGKKPYDGAKELYQMMDYEALPEEMKGVLNNYKIQVLEVGKFKDIDCFRTDLREVLGFIQRAGDVKAERKFTFENEEKFKAMDEDAVDVIIAVTGSTELADVKDAYREEGGKINMCEAIRGMIEEGRLDGFQQGIGQGLEQGFEQGIKQGIEQGLEQGLEQGIEQGLEQGIEQGIEQGLGQGIEQGVKALVELCQELGITKQDTIGKVMDKFSLDRAGAAEGVKRYWRL